jgi:hypothetical protein
MQIVGELTAWMATALAATSAVPQLRRLRTTRDLTGVSLSGPAIGAVTEAGWLVYVAQVGLWSAAVEPVLMVLANVALVVAICRRGGRLDRAVIVGAAWSAALILITMAGGWAALGAMLGVAYGVQVTPHVWSAYRVETPTGIAPRTWTMNFAEAVLWGTYGLAHGDGPIVLYAVIGTASSAAILGRARVSRGGPVARGSESEEYAEGAPPWPQPARRSRRRSILRRISRSIGSTAPPLPERSRRSVAAPATR